MSVDLVILRNMFDHCVCDDVGFLNLEWDHICNWDFDGHRNLYGVGYLDNLAFGVAHWFLHGNRHHGSHRDRHLVNHIVLLRNLHSLSGGDCLILNVVNNLRCTSASWEATSASWCTHTTAIDLVASARLTRHDSLLVNWDDFLGWHLL